MHNGTATTSRTLLLIMVLMLSTLLLGQVRSYASPSAASPATVRPAHFNATFQQLRATAQQNASVRVIVVLDLPPPPAAAHVDDDVISTQRDLIAATTSNVQRRLARHDLTIARTFSLTPAFVAEVSPAALEALAQAPEVVSLEPDRLLRPLMDVSTALIGAPEAWAAGFTGQGQVVAVLDTGVDAQHPFLAGQVVAEACFSSTTSTSLSLCPGGLPASFAPGAGTDCDLSISGCGHGTHVAGSIAGTTRTVIHNGQTRVISGVAPDARLIAVQVFSRVTDPGECQDDPVPCSRSYTSDVIAGLEHVYSLRDRFSIASVNMSLGSGRSQEVCDADPHRPIIERLRSVGIATVVAAGNDGFSDALAFPACISSAVSVGATSVDDQVASFSNSAPMLDLLAPGVNILSAEPGQNYAVQQGTSMAAPHVAGAWAILKQINPNASVGVILDTLQTTGRPVTAVRAGFPPLTTPRIQLNEALDLDPLPSVEEFPDFLLFHGQADLASVERNRGVLSAETLGAQMLGVAADAAGGVYVADQVNRRVLYYPPGSTTASRVYGQPDFTTRDWNLLRSGATRLRVPSAVAVGADGVYIADGPRVLFYPGISTTATRVYGQPNFETWHQNLSCSNDQCQVAVSATSLNYVTALAVSSTGLYVADAGNNRVLFFPGSSTTATRVYGQPNFSGDASNQGGVSANSLDWPTGLAVSAEGLYIVDSYNHRVLFFAGTSTTASRVYGQPNFTTNTYTWEGPSATTISFPNHAALDSSGRLYVADSTRVVVYPVGGTVATDVYGQDTLTSMDMDIDYREGGPARFIAYGIAVDGNERLIVADRDNSRVLSFPLGVKVADRVYGQPDFSSLRPNRGRVGSDSLSQPLGIARAADGRIYVADSANHRVLSFPPDSPIPDRVYGQPDFVSAQEGHGASGLTFPSAVALVDEGVYIADEGNGRVLFFPESSTTATRVYGYPDFDSRGGNEISATSLSYQFSLAADASGLYVTDGGNHRVLFFPGTSTTATRVYGQPDFSTNTANHNGVSATSLNIPSGVAIGSDGIYVSDQRNNRVLFYPGSSTTATRVYGQPDLTSNSYRDVTDGFNSPSGLVVDANDNLYVLDGAHNIGISYQRIPVFLAGSTTIGPVYTFGEDNCERSIPLSVCNPRGMALDADGSLLISDTFNHRIVIMRDRPISGVRAVHRTSAVRGVPVSFQARLGGGTTVDFNWDFGDGTTAQGARVSHTFTTAGTYTVTLRAAHWCTGLGVATTTTTIVVTEPPLDPTLNLNFTTGAPGSAFLLSGTNFPAGVSVGLSVNGVVIGNRAADNDGNLRVLLQTAAAASDGFYEVSATVGGTATNGIQAQTSLIAPVRYQLGADLPMRVPPADAPASLFVPASIGPSATPTPTATADPSPTPTSTATAGPSATPTPTATADPSPTPTSTATAGPSATPTSTATAGPSPTAGPTQPPLPTPTSGPVTAPLLYINYPDGAPGSSFLVIGYHFPAGARVQLRINGVVVGSLFTVEQDGSFRALIATNSSADEGYYVIVATVTTSSTSLAQPRSSAADQQSYQLATAAPARQAPPGAPPAVAVPPSIPAFEELPVVYLPLVRR